MTDPTIIQRITFTLQCHDFYERDSQHYKLMEWIEIGQSADMRRRASLPYPTHPLEHSHCNANPTRTVRVHREHLPMWSECTGRTRRSGRSVYTGNPARTVRERYAARRVKLSV